MTNLLALMMLCSFSVVGQTHEKETEVDSLFLYQIGQLPQTGSIYILFEPELNYVLKVDGKNRQHLRYPNDYTRTFFISQFEQLSDSDTTKPKKLHRASFSFSTIPQYPSKETKPYGYEEISVKDFEAKNPLTQEWFNTEDWNEIQMILSKAEHVYIVDKGYLRDGKYTMIKVKFFVYYIVEEK